MTSKIRKRKIQKENDEKNRKQKGRNIQKKETK